MAKLQPVQTTLHYRLPGSVQGGYIDLSQSASLINRKFFRQGLQWAVAGMDIYTASGVSGRILVEKIPDGWISTNSWVKGFSNWNKMIRNALAETESVRPKFLDFKVFADHSHAQAGVGANLLPQTSPLVGAGGFADPTEGDWDMSTVQIPDTLNGGIDEREIIFVGQSYQGAGASGLFNVGLIEGYAASRLLPNIRDPNAPDDAADTDGAAPENWIGAMFNEGISQSAEVIEDMITENTQAPYPFENDGTNTDTMYPGGANQFPNLALHDMVDITGTTVGAHSSIRGGVFNCGLIKIFKETGGLADGETTVTDVLVHLVPGKHRGYLAQPMKEVN
jgi:hypothetical protein